MSAPKFVVRNLRDRASLAAFMRKVNPASASIHGDVWLLKPTTKGGTTIGRVIVASDDDAVDSMISEVFHEVTEQ